MPRDIEEFLKMAAARRAQQKRQGGGPPPQQAPPPQQPPQLVPPRQPLHPPVDDDDIVILPDDPGVRTGSSVAEHVKTHLDTSDIADHARHLGAKVGLADEKLESRLHRKFDHSVGHLHIDASRSAQSETTAVTQTQVSHIAQELIGMLRSPKSVRQAIIMNEILRRPEI